jgi:iron complex outermembrane receptor protein
MLVELNRRVETGDDGSYEFTQVPAGRHTVSAHLHALTNEKRTVEVTPGAVVEASFALNVAAVREEVTVTATGREQSTLEAFQTVTSLTGHELTTRAAAPSLGDLLDTEAGVAKRSFGPGTSRPVVRGFDGDRVLVLQDGIRTGTLSSQSGDHGEPVDATALERVEVVRGPATLLYGSNAIGGVVNVITRHHELEEHPHEGVRGHLSGIAGSANAQGGGSGGFEAGTGSWLLWGSGGGQRTGDYDTPIGSIENSFSNLYQATGGLGRYADRAFFTLGYGVQDGKYGVPPIELEEDPEAHAHENVNIDWRRHNLRFHGGFRNLKGWLEAFRATLNYSDWHHNEVEDDQIATRFFNKQLTWRGVFEQRSVGVLSGSFGVWGMRRDYSTRGEESLTPPVDQNAVAVFGLEEFDLEHFRIQVGGRLERNAYSAQGLRSRDFTGLSGAAGLYVPTWRNAAVVFNYTSSYRAPALEELYNRGPHLGNLAYEIGNPDLVRERGHGFELSFRHRGTRARVEITGFYNRMNDFVYLAPTGGEEDGLIEAQYDQADARYLGAEARADIGLTRAVWLNLGFDAVDAQLRASNTPLPRIPPVRGRVGLQITKGGFVIRPELLLANWQWQIFPTEEPTAGYVVGNLIATYTFATQHTLHSFGLNFFNAGDKLYRNHLSFIKQFAPEIGRGVRFTYTLHFF